MITPALKKYTIDHRDDLNQLVIGSLLGDGTLKYYPQTKNASLKIRHGANQLDYLKYKRSILAAFDLVTNTGKLGIYKDTSYLKNLNTYYIAYELVSRSHSVFTYWDAIAYTSDSGRRKKRFCMELLDKLGPLGLAIWYCDDGSLAAYRRKHDYGVSCQFATDGFSKSDNMLIIEYFHDTWGLEFYPLKAWGGTYTCLRAKEASTRKLLSIIAPYVPNTMQYKIDPVKRLEFHFESSRLNVLVETGN